MAKARPPKAFRTFAPPTAFKSLLRGWSSKAIYVPSLLPMAICAVGHDKHLARCHEKSKFFTRMLGLGLIDLWESYVYKGKGTLRERGREKQTEMDGHRVGWIDR